MKSDLTQKLSQFLRFAASGLLSTLVDQGSFQGLRLLMTPEWANAASMCLSLAVNFALNRRWTFGARGSTARSLTLYLILFAVNTIVASLAVGWLHAVGMDDRLAKLGVMLVVSCWNYALYKTVIFRPEKGAGEAGAGEG